MLVEILVRTGDFAAAVKNIQMLHDESQRVSSTSALAIARAKQGDIVDALAMVNDGSDEYDTQRADWTRAHIMIEEGKLGKYPEASQTAHLITDDKIRAGALIVLGSGVPMPDKDDVAAPIFSEARSAALKIPELYFRATALSHLAGVLSVRGEFADARNAADAIQLNAEEYMLGDLEKHRGHALENIAYWQCKMRTCQDALEWVVRERSPILRSYAIAGAVEAMLGLKPPSDHYIEENYGW
jgi:HEAT repeat protein